MGSLPAPESEHSFAQGQTSLDWTENDHSEPEASTTDVDRKTKKRIQNRVAQRTYRRRIKQRLQDLQQQVYRMQQTGQEQYQDAQPQETGAHYSSNGAPELSTTTTECLTAMSINSHSTDEVKFEESGCGVLGLRRVPDPWASMPSEFMWNPPHQGPSLSYDNSFQVPEKLSLGMMSESMMSSSPSTIPPMDMKSSEPCLPRRRAETHPRGSLISSRVGGNTERNCLCKASNVFADEEEARLKNFANLGSPPFGSDAWENDLQLGSPADSTPATTATPTGRGTRPSPHNVTAATTPSTTTAPTELSEDNLPSPHATVEEQFEYVLSCAQRVGFDSFDTMALQYYGRNFSSASPLALEQRLSRNRRLPGLLAELRKRSADWSTWQRRGYQDETLKAAEEICAIEFSEFWKREASGRETESAKEKTLEDTLPNLWALLMGLASSNPLLPQKNLSKVVFMSMKLLCGLGGGSTQGATSEKQLSRR